LGKDVNARIIYSLTNNKLVFLIALAPILLVPLVRAQTDQQQADKEKAIADQNLTKMCHEERNAILNMSKSNPLFQMNMDTYKTSTCEDRTGVINK
jgi:hypothetical protein